MKELKKIVFVLICVMAVFVAHAQLEKGKVIVSLDGNYIDSPSGIGVITNSITTKGKQLNLDGEAEYFLSGKISVGIGMDYGWTKEKRTFNSFHYNKEAQIENMDVKQNSFLPYVSLAYHYKIMEKFYFSTKLALGYGKVKSDYESTVAYATNVDDSLWPESESRLYGNKGDTDYDLAGASLTPKLSYFLSQKVGLYLSLGGIDYTMVDWKSNDSTFSIDFSPKYWSLGINIAL